LQQTNNLPAAEAAVIVEPVTLRDFISDPATVSGMVCPSPSELAAVMVVSEPAAKSGKVCPSPSEPAAVMVVDNPVIVKGEYNYLVVLIVSLDLL